MVSPKVRITVLAAVLAGLIATVVICRAENFTDLKPSPQALEWQDLDETAESPKPMMFWVKELKS